MVTGDGRPRETAGLSAGTLQPQPRQPPTSPWIRKRVRLENGGEAEVARLLLDPGAVWVGGAAREMDATAAEFGEEEERRDKPAWRRRGGSSTSKE